MLQILIYGAVSSAIYAMLAVGFTLDLRRRAHPQPGARRVLRARRAYSAFTMTSLLSLPLLIAAPLVRAGRGASAC